MVISERSSKTIDFHVHIYTGREGQALKKRFGARTDEMGRKFRGRDLSINGLNEAMRSSGIERAVVLPVVTPSKFPNVTTNGVANKLTWLHKKLNANDRLFGFGTLHPDMEFAAIDHAVKRIRAYDWPGVKFHSPQQRFDPVSEKIFDILSLLEDNNLAVLMDTFYDRAYFEHFDIPRECALDPRKLQLIAREHPNLTIIAAHMAGFNWWGEANIFQELKPKGDLYLDTSSSHSITEESFRRFINRFGIDHIVFGSDHPYHDMAHEIQRIQNLGLSDSELEAVMYRNAERLLNERS